MNKEFILAVPLYNEKKYVGNICREIRKYYTGDLLIFNDGSTDGSLNCIKKIKDIIICSHDSREGYGRTIIDIFSYSIKNNYKYLITMDCDFQHEPRLIPDFKKEILNNNYDIVSGSRYLIEKNYDHVPHDRYEINKKVTFIINSICKEFIITDSFCGFKAYNTEKLKLLRLDESGYSLPLQLLIQAYFLDLKIKEVPVDLIYHDYGRSFGEQLDQPETRYKYYLNTIKREVNLWQLGKRVQL